MRPRGFSLLELLIVVTLFSLVAGVTLLLLSRSGQFWRESSGNHTAALNLATAARHFQSDLPETSQGAVQTSTVPSSLSGAPDGSAIWFLSSRDPSTAGFARKDDGTPFWQRNVLYYSVVPRRHLELYGLSCAGGPGPGNDAHCPHKLLIRKVIDSGVPTSLLTDPLTSEETLLANVDLYLTRPDGLNISAMRNEEGVTDVKIVTTGLTYFEAESRDNEIALDLRATPSAELGRSLKVGDESLLDHRLTRQYYRSFFPKN